MMTHSRIANLYSAVASCSIRFEKVEFRQDAGAVIEFLTDVISFRLNFREMIGLELGPLAVSLKVFKMTNSYKNTAVVSPAPSSLLPPPECNHGDETTSCPLFNRMPQTLISFSL